MNWDQLRGHALPRELLRRSLQRGRLAHTWLFTGPSGIGKKKFAVLLAQSLFCERHAEVDLDCCGECPACRQIQVESHPDFHLIGCPEGKREIPIELFLGAADKRGREGLCHALAQTPLAGQRKIAIIDDADLLNEASANALLKTLEEPPGHSLIVLIAANRDAILPTILSRCQVLRFQPLSEADVSGILLAEGLAEDSAAAEQAARLSEGSLTTAQALLDAGLFRDREQIFAALAVPLFNSIGLARKLMEGIEDAGAESSRQRQRAEWQIRFLVEFLREAFLSLTLDRNESRIPEVNRWLESFDRRSETTRIAIEELIERVIRTSEELEQNVSLALCLETLCDDLGKQIRKMPRAVGLVG